MLVSALAAVHAGPTFRVTLPSATEAGIARNRMQLSAGGGGGAGVGPGALSHQHVLLWVV